MEFLEALKRAPGTTRFYENQLIDQLYLRVPKTRSISKTWVPANFKLSDATLLAFKVDKNNNQSDWWRDVSRVPLKSIALRKDLILEPMVLENTTKKLNNKGPMFTSKLVDQRTNKTVLRVSVHWLYILKCYVAFGYLLIVVFFIFSLFLFSFWFTFFL